MKMLKIAAACAVALMLAGCFLSPGKFTAGLDVRKDGSFTYRYDGEVVILTPQSIMSMGAEASALGDVFDPKEQKCFGDPPARKKRKTAQDMVEDDLLLEEGPERECTPEEIEQARADWETKRADEKKQMEAARAFFGGLDPQDPKTVAEFVRRLQTYQGWKQVVHKGNGVFDVRYEVSGRLDRDFVFPLLPEIDAVIPFVRANRRADGSVRITAPVFGQDESMMSSRSMGAAMAAAGPSGLPSKMPRPEGVFTITTDAEILTNNTDEGPAAGAGSAKVLKWTVGPLDHKKPEALIRF